MATHPRLTIRDLRARPVSVPMRIPLQTSGGTVRVAPLALVDLVTEEGVTGHTYLFCYTPLVLQAACASCSRTSPRSSRAIALAPLEIDRKLQRAIPPARRQGDRRHGARRHRHGGVGCAGARRPACRSCALLGGDAARDPRLQQLRPGHHRPRARRGRGAAAGRGGLLRDQGPARLRRTRRPTSRSCAPCARAVGDDVHLMSRLQPVPHGARGRAARTRRWPTKACTGSRSPTSRTTTRATRTIRAEVDGLPSRWARTGGGRTRWRSAWRPAPRTSACPTR